MTHSSTETPAAPTRPSDFNDLARLRGLGAVRAQVEAAIGAAKALADRPPERDSARPGGNTKAVSVLMMRRATEIECEAVTWIKRGYLPRGKVTLIAGDPGLGKSMLTAAIAAQVSQGRPWPAGRGPCPVGDVVILSAEDGAGDTIVPRLRAAGADLDRVHVVDGIIRTDEDGKEIPGWLSLKEDLEAIRKAVKSLPDPALLLVDPISAYLGSADSHSNAEVRSILAPLSELAEELNVAVLVVSHLNKGSGGPAIYRTIGSLAFVGGPRAAFLVTRDKDDENRRLLVPQKFNLGPMPDGLAFTIATKHFAGLGDVPHIVWADETVKVSADEALAHPRASGGERSKLDLAVEWLEALLQSGPVSNARVKEEAEAAGFVFSMVKRAKAVLGAPSVKGGFGDAGEWFWHLPKSRSSDGRD